ncbi:hypothetical protein L6164_017308 [Bauhinia variegata]|uniref:Uncharacterized protein n=1 Tax=Bauhinia variegata TaxID=167791 RepID=A0ACB9N7C7_BAUVA|nr:hypothetical protein L6164_017308 [Bauhinia variegata]
MQMHKLHISNMIAARKQMSSCGLSQKVEPRYIDIGRVMEARKLVDYFGEREESAFAFSQKCPSFEPFSNPTIATITKIIGVWFLVAIFIVEAEALARGFVQTNGTEFVLNGSSFLFNGFNSYWLMNVASDPTQSYKVSTFSGRLHLLLLGFVAHGHSVKLFKNLQESVMSALDFVVSEARKYRTKLILCLVDNFDEYGGKKQYVQWARSAGVPVTYDDYFYSNAVIIGYNKNNVKKINYSLYFYHLCLQDRLRECLLALTFMIDTCKLTWMDSRDGNLS